DHMAEQLQAVKNAGLVYLPNSKTQTGEDLWDVGFLSDDKRGDMFQGVLSDLSTQILRGLLIPDRSATSGEGTGSYAQAEVHANVLASTLEDIQKEFISDVIEPQVVDPLVLYNFGPDALDKTPVRIKAGGLTNEKKQVLFEVMKAVMATDPTLPEEKQSGILRRLDLPAIAAALELPMLSASEVEEREESTGNDDPENGSPDSGIDDQDEIGIPDERAIADELTQRGVLEEGN
ncbi:MAG: DUF935 domain-containing protein, partial [Deltaproteobacteria bacterium]|nr:DUF935 domain-containing protein [Deltaproteobacteria bacterium]